MTILYIDGFDHYGSGANGVNNMFGGPWTGTTTGASVGVPTWGPARTGLNAYGSAGSVARKVLPAAKAEVFISMGFAMDSLPAANLATSICTFRDNSNAIMANLYVDTTGGLRLVNAANTTLAVTAGPVLIARNWHFLEILWDKTDGTFTVRVDDATGTGTPAMAATSLSFASNCAQITVNESLAFGETVTNWCDDVMIRDTLGSVNNGWLGDRRVATLFANTDTSTSGWTPSYYQRFGAGILRLSWLIAGNSSDQNIEAFVSANADTSLDIGNADFTLETQIRFDRLPTGSEYATIFNRWDTTGDHRSYRLTYGGASFNGNCIQFDTSTDGTSSTVSTPIQYPWTPETNVWYSLALCRTAGELLLFVNGIQLGLPITDSNTYYSGGTERFAIGAQNVSGGSVVTDSYLVGRLDETRFTNGVGRYSTTYTPQVAAFPRGSGGDTHWADVVLLCGYDSAVNDESGFTRALSTSNGAISFIPADGPSVGVYSTVNKATPDDNTFISAEFLPATNILTMTTQPVANNTITLGTTDGSTPAVYTYKASVSSAFDVKIGATAALSLANFLNAVNSGPGSGTNYGTGTTANFDVSASPLPTGQIEVTANVSGTGGNSIVSTATGTAAVWDSTTLLGGTNIPGPSAFRLQRPPNNTTIISGLQINVRALKTDAGLADIQSSLIGGQGTEDDGAIHPLTTSVTYYADVFETDPDTSGPISPTTIINGEVQINRTT